MIDLYLVRHGESIANTDMTVIGGRASKSPLSDKGVDQCCKATKTLSLIKFDDAFSSTATRAIQTAEIIMSGNVHWDKEK